MRAIDVESVSGREGRPSTGWVEFSCVAVLGCNGGQENRVERRVRTLLESSVEGT